jgi:protein-L-isoaspartate(D-aspartate) O-methyltransferase
MGETIGRLAPSPDMSNNEIPAVLSPGMYGQLRTAMVDAQIRRRGVTDERVLRAMASVPRHEFVPPQWQNRAYEDEPLPIGAGQTISQPYIVAVMTAALRLTGTEKVLEIGTGCGYQAAVLSQIAREIFTVECRSELARASSARLQLLECHNVHLHCGDGSLGLMEFAPFDAILVAAAAPALPAPLLEQLAEAGRMIAPVGGSTQQELVLVRRHGTEYDVEHHEGCRFVPLQGRYGWKEHEIG